MSAAQWFCFLRRFAPHADHVLLRVLAGLISRQPASAILDDLLTDLSEVGSEVDAIQASELGHIMRIFIAKHPADLSIPQPTPDAQQRRCSA